MDNIIPSGASVVLRNIMVLGSIHGLGLEFYLMVNITFNVKVCMQVAFVYHTLFDSWTKVCNPAGKNDHLIRFPRKIDYFTRVIVKESRIFKLHFCFFFKKN